jgi:hypothetical protein
MRASLDDAIADSWEEHQFLIDNGLLDPDQPTRHATYLDRRWRQNLGRPFDAEERREIRFALGLSGAPVEGEEQ